MKRRPAAFSHLDRRGRASMVDVGDKPVTLREAVAMAEVRMRPATLARLRARKLPKGDVLSTARVAGILAAKRVDGLIPLCHTLPLDHAAVDFAFGRGRVTVKATARVRARTGVEMEALTAAAVAALTVYDMAKAVDRGMTITNLRLLEKKGGRSGHYVG